MPMILFVELNSVHITFSFSNVIIILKNTFCKIKWRSVKCFLKEFYVTFRYNSVCADETKSYEHFSKLIRVDRGHILIFSDEGLTLELETIRQRANARDVGLRRSLSCHFIKIRVSEPATIDWPQLFFRLWKWLPLRFFKHQSLLPITVLPGTNLTRTIRLHDQLGEVPTS